MLRRNFMQGLSLSPFLNYAAALPAPSLIKPPKLKKGDTIGFVCPAAPAYSRETVKIIQESMEALGFKVKMGPNLWARHGYLAGTDEQRANDLNLFFADDSVQAILCVHGGWGCARLLPLLDYATIRKNPKIIIGYSDITALLLGIHAQTGLVTFHGPEGAATWNAFTVGHFKTILLEGGAPLYQNPVVRGDNLTQTQNRIYTIHSGIAQGPLLGGNLTVLCHLLGSPYVPNWSGALLFCEDVDEAPYSMDRMLTHLKLTGAFEQMNGFIFGKCTHCQAGGEDAYGSLTLEDLWHEGILPRNKPAFAGSMIGHIADKFTIPLGIRAEMNADKGTIQLLESAVS